MSAIHFPRKELLLIIAIGFVTRLLVLTSGSVTFHADEAVVGLMARHIVQGETPTFFYGQAYMGSLDAYLVSTGFRLLGDSVNTIRLVQMALYLSVVATGYIVAWRFSGSGRIALAAGLLLAVPTVNVTLYTTATLGGYNETLLFGNLLLLLSYDVTHEHRYSRWRWGTLGFVGGLGWWTNGLIVAYALPVALLLSYMLFIRRILPVRSAFGMFLLAVAAFLVGSAPWWIFDITHNGAAMSTFIRSQQTGEFAGIGIPYVPPLERALGLAVIGIPALLGMRFPWSAEYFLLPVGVIVLVGYGVAILRLFRGSNPLRPEARALLLGMPLVFFMVFIASSFGADPTGRYFLPLALPLAIVLGTLVKWPDDGTQTRLLRPSVIGLALLTIVIGYQAAAIIQAIRVQPPGLTTQFDLVSHLPNDDDMALMDFLDTEQLYNGYTNYWVAFRLAFLSGERMQYSAALPYKTDLSYNTADNRYPAYVEAVAQAERVAFITTNLPALDAQLIALFEAQGLTYREAQIGVFHIYYDFEPVRPDFTNWSTMID